ncbi:uncharacterized protein hemgn isoform X2 [Halichoeres trimaculatus]|uniref:uncharacterized protein hemgn isoform X2 n=1 Tax=Halichoeres trimaculatus TaxID=147232 RepID=UPI003D9EE9C5
MEGTSQQENQELEYKNPEEDQGGIRRRLRDRDLLRKRKAEAEAKETNQEESQRKRPRAENKSGAKRRGRPRKTEPTPEISVSQEEVAVPQVAPIGLPEPAEVTPDQTSGSLESQPASVLAAPAPLQLFGSFQNPVFGPALTSPAPGDPTPPLISPSGPSPSSTKILDTAQIPIQELAPVLALAPGAVPVPASDQDLVKEPGLVPVEIPVPPAAPGPQSAPAQVETPYTGAQGKEALNKVIIEDLGPDEEEDITLSEEKQDDEDLSGTPSFSAPEQSKIFSVPTLSSQPPPPEYLPGNSV